MVYRVAWIPKGSDVWQWKSTQLSSLQAVLGFLQLYRAIARERLQVFAAASPQDLEGQLALQNLGREHASLTSASSSCQMMPSWAAREVTPAAAFALLSQRGPNLSVPETTEAWSRQSLDQRRLAVELGPGGDKDVPYAFALPPTLSEALGWIRLLITVRRGGVVP